MSGIFGRLAPVMHAAAKNAFPYRNPTPTRKSAPSVYMRIGVFPRLNSLR